MDETKRKSALQRLQDACEQWAAVGPWRRGERNLTALEFLVVPKVGMEKSPEDFFADVQVNKLASEREALVREGLLSKNDKGEVLLQNGMVLVFHEVKAYAFASTLVHLTGPKNYLMEIHTAAKAKGYAWIVGAGFKKIGHSGLGAFVAPKTEDEFFKFLGLPYLEPENRKWGTIFPSGKPNTDEPLTPEQMGAWVASSRWVGSSYAGQAHQFTLRIHAESDDMFLRVIKQIHDFGYKGEYQVKQYRYLDLGEHFYFTQGYRWNETQMINRKFRTGTEARPPHPWVRNNNPLRLLTVKEA